MPMAMPPNAGNALDLEPRVVKSNYVCVTMMCNFESTSAALARDHLEDHESHELEQSYTWQD